MTTEIQGSVNLYTLPPKRFDELPKLPVLSDNMHSETRRQNLEAGIEICIVADYNDMIIGEINIMLKNDNIPSAVIPNKRAYLYGFNVRSELRGFGVGRALLTEAIRACNMRGYIEQTVAAEKGCSAIVLYEKLGFRLFLKDLEFNGIDFDLFLRVGDLG